MLGGRKLATSSRLLLFLAVTVSYVDPSTPLQFCGKDLANALALVCSETGYNLPPLFRFDPNQSSSEGRYTRDIRIRRTRGIVDECCRTSCGWSTIETYCRPSPSSTTSENLQIQKRSDPPSEAFFIEQVKGYSREDAKGIRHEKKRLLGSTEETVTQKQNRIFHSAPEVDVKRRLDSSKVKRNDRRTTIAGNSTTGQHKEAYNDSLSSGEVKSANAGDKAVKFHRGQGRHHRSGKPHHNKDLKRGKGAQIGTVSPFFFGRTLVSPKARKTPFQ